MASDKSRPTHHTSRSKKSPPKRILSRRTDFLWRLGALAVLWVIVLGRGCLFRPKSNFPGAHFNNGTNAAWLEVEWVSRPHSSDEVLELATALAQRQITTVYVYTSYYKPEGSFSSTYGYAEEFVATLKGFAPDLSVQMWIGLPLRQMNLNSRAIRREVVDFCASLLPKAGFDGLHLDPEPVEDGNQAVLTLLEELREAIGPEVTLSIAGRRIWPIFPTVHWPLVGEWSWSASYYQKIAGRVDEIAVMVYDSSLSIPALYQQWTKFEVIALSRTLVYSDVRLFIGIPTSAEVTRTHNPAAENMRTGLRGVITGLNDWATWPNTLTGVAIYPYWETDETEWKVYQSLWLGE
ncbi:MAG TPA: glycoside hydrolase family 18 protein [Anaerolineae bacterium]|nr:glycoside hydrolase family 18 protein [Anaerolineae bacterium]HQH38694.1 glycoside hydrolase family 18 protein [Anaerolineae bacterium]